MIRRVVRCCGWLHFHFSVQLDISTLIPAQSFTVESRTDEKACASWIPHSHRYLLRESDEGDKPPAAQGVAQNWHSLR